MTDRTPIRREILDTFDVVSQGLHDTDYVELCKEVKAEVNTREQRIYRRRREIFEKLAASTSGC